MRHFFGKVSKCVEFSQANMASSQVTFTLDDITIARLKDAAARRALPQSQIVREAIAEYHERIGRLSESEKLRLLRTFDELVPRIPKRSAASMDRELRALRNARRSGGRRAR